MNRRWRGPSSVCLAAALAVTAGAFAPPGTTDSSAPTDARPAGRPLQPTNEDPLFDHAEKLAGFPEQQWFEGSIPFVDLPADEGGASIEEIYYYRWSVTKRMLRYAGPHDGWYDAVFVFGPWMGPNAMRDLRWLRHPGIVENDIATHQITEGLRYTDPTADNVHQYALATGRTDLLVDALPDLVDQWHARDDYFDEEVGLYWHQPVWDATEHTIAAKKTDFVVPMDVQFPNPEDFLLPLHEFFGGWGYSTPLNTAQAADARVIAETARLVGDETLAEEFERRSTDLTERIIDHLWDDDRDFFYHVMRDNEAQGYLAPDGSVYPEGTELSGREIWGYYPWQFELLPDDARFAGAWDFLEDPEGFGTPYGPSTAEVRDPDTDTSGAYSPDKDNGNCCRWDGAAWPYSHARTLVSAANALNSYEQLTPEGADAPALTVDDYVELLDRYARLQYKDGEPYVAEAADSVTGQWIYDKPNRSEHYNAYPFTDLVLNGLLGVRPQADETLVLNPLVPEEWTHFAAENIPYHGRDLAFAWDQDGSHYGRGAGLSVWLDGELVAQEAALGELTIDVGPTVVPEAEPLSTASRYDGSRANFAADTPQAFPAFDASYAGYDNTRDGGENRQAEEVRNAFDGAHLYDDDLDFAKWSTRGSPNQQDWLSVDFGTERTLDEARIAIYQDEAVAPPSGLRLERWDGDGWAPLAEAGPGQLVGDDVLSLPFAEPVTTSRLRLLLPEGDAPVGITELEAWGPAEQLAEPVNCPSAGPQHYEAEHGVVNLGGKQPSAAACGYGVVGGLNTEHAYFVDDWSAVRPGDFGDTRTGPMWQGFNGTSDVSFYVDVPEARTWTVQVRYANGIAGSDGAYFLSVNGGERTPIQLPATGGWSGSADNIATATFEVDLTAGPNTITFTKGAGFAEFDSIDLE
ncbi:glycosyl hydrolase family 65 protein [Streptomyces sp. NBRC 109706]|uniref:MGH1-like glycoside hydrolase domain-containing protein n=1 Tax=Streptomyces sp. NBRC 109706 TaxID=1550035 RepID=UPI000784707B|nr:glycosyl hydrolase family 65 protein [Streptomyces sp. NBRC 109706]